jgi:hypothetical protein
MFARGGGTATSVVNRAGRDGETPVVATGGNAREAGRARPLAAVTRSPSGRGKAAGHDRRVVVDLAARPRPRQRVRLALDAHVHQPRWWPARRRARRWATSSPAGGQRLPLEAQAHRLPVDGSGVVHPRLGQRRVAGGGKSPTAAPDVFHAARSSNQHRLTSPGADGGRQPARAQPHARAADRVVPAPAPARASPAGRGPRRRAGTAGPTSRGGVGHAAAENAY